MTMGKSLLLVALLVAFTGYALSYPAARKFDLAEELLTEDTDADYDDVKKDEVAGSGSETARKDDVAATKPAEEDAKKEETIEDNPESDESESPASGEEETSSGDSDIASSGSTASDEEEEGTKRKRAVAGDDDDDDDKKEYGDEEDTVEGSGPEGSGESEDKGQEAEVKKNKVSVKSVCGSKRCECECECEDDPDEEHEHEHHCHGHDEGCHGHHECEHHHCDDHGHHEHDDCCHHHGHHHGFVHEWGEECCGDHDCHDCCGEHEHEHHDDHDHHHEHCCHDKHCCHHKEEEEEEPEHCCCCHKKSKIGKKSGGGKKGKNTKRETVPAQPVVKKQTVHVGYGYASGDNYRLGYQQGGMGGLASTFTGQIGAEQQGSYDAADHYNKRVPQYQPGPVREKRFYGGHAFGNMESGIAHGSATPYGHPVTHPGFTTMGFPGHALASQDVRTSISHPHTKRSIVYEDELPYYAYSWTLPYELVQ